MGVSGQFRGHFRHARTAGKPMFFLGFQVSRTASAGSKVDKSGQFSQGARRRVFDHFLIFEDIFNDFSEISSL